MKPWLKYAIGAQTGLLVGMGLGRFSYTPMIPVLIETRSLSEAEAGYIGALNLGGYVIGALITPWLSHRFHEAWVIRVCLLAASTCLIASIFPFGFFINVFTYRTNDKMYPYKIKRYSMNEGDV